METNRIQLPPYPDLTLAKIRLKLSNMATELGIDEYEDDCVDIIFDYTLIYMKSVIRSMARHKRKYKVVCPILSGKNEKKESSNAPKEKIPEKKLWPWQVRTNWDKEREQYIKFLEENNISHVEEKDFQKEESFDHEAWFSELLISDENVDIGASYRKRRSDALSKTVGESSSNVDNSTKSTNKRSSEEYNQKTVKKKTNECVISEIIYSPGQFTVKDLVDLLKMDTHIIPLRSIYHIYMHYSLMRLPRIIIPKS